MHLLGYGLTFLKKRTILNIINAIAKFADLAIIFLDR